LPEEKLYEWTVLMRDDRMGFGRVYAIQATSVADACNKARSESIQAKYQPDQLVVISATRGREVGT